MSFVLKKVLDKFRFRGPSRYKKTASEDIRLALGVGGDPTSTPAVNALELAEERVRWVRLEHDHQVAQAEATEMKRRLEDEIHRVKKLLEARERDLSRKDASLQHLEKVVNEMRAKVGLAENRVGSNS